LDEMNGNKLQDALIAAALKHADRVAVTFDMGSGPENCVSLSYKEVVGHGNELSSSLRNVCRENNGLIGLYVQNDLYLPVWIFGILQLPAAYLPLNPDVPGILSARIMSMCDLNYCTLQSSLFEHFQKKFSKLITVEVCAVWPDYNLTLVRVQPLSSAVILDLGTQQEGTRRACEEWPHASTYLADYTKKGDFAYVLHTSGTTGLPKIVRVPHKCIVPNIQHLRSLFQIGAEDLVFLASPLTFDPSVVEIFLALSSGARLLIAPSVIKKAPNRLAKLLFKDHKTTVLQVTPTLLGRFGHRTLTEEVLSAGSSLRVLALGGEACPSLGLLRSWRQEGNRTQMYNVYGITEVSCWASCHQVPESLLKSSHQAASSIPIGAPLLNTSVEVRDDWGCVITAGQGQLFIGGQERVCLIDDESTMVPGTMRATGDWVEMEGKHLHYLGRRDRLVKRNGQRVNLDTVQQVMMSLPQVESCAVGLFKGLRLVAFVVGDWGFLEDLPEDGSRSDAPIRVLHRVVLQQLSLLVPSASIPDSLVLVQALPLTAHGKVDMNALMKLYQQQREHLESVNSFENMAKLKQRLICLWQDSLGLPEDAVVEDDSLFLFSGGDSLKALRLCDDIIATVGLGVPGLLEAILEGSFTEVVCLVARATRLSPAANNIPNAPSARKRSADHPASSTMVKREHTETYSAPHHLHGPVGSTDGRLTKVLRRAGQVLELNVSNPVTLSGSHCKTISANIKNDYSAKDTSETGIQRALVPELEPRSPELRVRWSSDMGRCVDASPLLVVVQDREAGGTGSKKATVFIGSHSHRMQALDLTTGGLLWERVLGDRIESSAVVMRCGTQLAGVCKNSVTTNTQVFGLQVAQKCVWKYHCGGGAVFSSPYLEPTRRRLYAASLRGHFVCLYPDSGEVMWTYNRETPFFSSPSGSPGCVVIGSVDGNICFFSDTGQLLWQFLAKGAVFSTPCFTPDRQRVLCGAHDGYVYCLETAGGSLVWSFQTSGRVYASPFAFESRSALGREQVLVGVASTDGMLWILDERDGCKIASLSLPGELFSSPVVWERTLLVGCRNDMVYCIDLTNPPNKEELEGHAHMETLPGTGDA
uniref:Aminoadipate-semialdehyde dehydrogenase n=1 Tax=Gadus morhua TaxID=8049 RepID=A0A8C4ZRG8_GADMO